MILIKSDIEHPVTQEVKAGPLNVLEGDGDVPRLKIKTGNKIIRRQQNKWVLH